MKRMLIAGLALGSLALSGCSLVEAAEETAEIVVENSLGVIGALIGFLVVGSGLGVVFGGFLGAVTSDDVQARLAEKAADLQVVALQQHVAELEAQIAAGPKSGADAAISVAEAVSALGLYAVIAVAIFFVAGLLLPRLRFPKLLRKSREDE